MCVFKIFVMFKKYFIYLILERGEGREKERERNIGARNVDWLPLARPQPGTRPKIQACALTGNRTSDLLVHRLVLSPLNHTSQGKIFLNVFHPHVPSTIIMISFKTYDESIRL